MCRRNIFACPGSFPDSFADQPHPDSLRKLCQPVRIQFHIFPLPGNKFFLQGNRLFFQIISYLLQLFHRRLHMLYRLRIHLYQFRKHPLSHPVSAVGLVGIGTVHTISLPPLLQKLFDLFPAALQKGTDIDFPVCSCPLWTHPAQSIQSASPDQLKQHGLRIVFHMMRQCDPDVSVLPGCIRKHLISQNSCRLFFSQMMYFGITWNINIPDMTDNPPLFTELFHKHRIIFTLFSTNSMLHVDNLK